jgi:hypothetical protein
LGTLLASIGDFDLDMAEMEANWRELNARIQDIIEKTPEFQDMVNKLRKAKVKGSWASMKQSAKKGNKVISLEDFLKPG